MEILLENGDVLLILTDKSSVEIAKNIELRYEFNERMCTNYFMVGYVTFSTRYRTVLASDMDSNKISRHWLKYDNDTKKYYSYITDSFIEVNRYDSFMTLFVSKANEMFDEFFYKKTFTCVFILKISQK